MVSDYCACPRDVQFKICQWRVRASEAHVDFWSACPGCSIMNSFYPENLLQSLIELDRVIGNQKEAEEGGDLYFLHQKRLFGYRQKQVDRV